MDFRSFSLTAWTLLVNNILCAIFGFNWHYCPQNIIVLVFNYLFQILWLSFGKIDVVGCLVLVIVNYTILLQTVIFFSEAHTFCYIFLTVTNQHWYD